MHLFTFLENHHIQFFLDESKVVKKQQGVSSKLPVLGLNITSRDDAFGFIASTWLRLSKSEDAILELIKKLGLYNIVKSPFRNK